MSDNTYTYDELAAAAAASRTTNEIVRRLGREPTPGRNRYVMDQLRELGIDCGHIDNTPRLYTREMLAEAAAASTSINEVVRYLGAKEVGGTQAYIGRQLRKYGIDTSHFPTLSDETRLIDYNRETLLAAAEGASTIVEVVQRLAAGPGRVQYNHVRHLLVREVIKVARGHQSSGRHLAKISPDEFRTAVAKARSVAECARLLETALGGAFYRYFRATAAELNLDTTHMTGQGHQRGRPALSRMPAADILVKNSELRSRVPAHRLRRAMNEIGMPYTCTMCGTGPEWQGYTIALEVDHINGDFTDNRPENLRSLCPNCHATTTTFCRKKSARRVEPS